MICNYCGRHSTSGTGTPPKKFETEEIAKSFKETLENGYMYSVEFFDTNFVESGWYLISNPFRGFYC